MLLIKKTSKVLNLLKKSTKMNPYPDIGNFFLTTLKYVSFDFRLI